MNVLSRIFGAPSTYELRAVATAPLKELHPRELYQLLDAYYQNNGLYDFLALAMHTAAIWKEALKPLRNPAQRVVEFYPMHLWPGTLPDALPIVSDNQRIVEPIQRVWKWSNWGTNKQLAARQLARLGDLFIKVTQTEDLTQVYFQLIEPKYVTAFEVDHRGFVTYIRVDIPRTRRSGDGLKHFTYTEVWDKQTALFRAWEHDKGAEDDIDQLGQPLIRRALAAGPGPDFVGVDFVPFVHAKFKDIGEERGVGAFTLALDKIDEANRKATRLAQMIFRYNKALWALSANAMDISGRPLPAPRIGGASGDPGDGDTITLGDDRLIRLPGTSKLESLVPQIDYQAHLDSLKADLEELEQDLPELTYYRLRETGNLSGRALQLLLAPAIKKAEEARGNAETALARADEMALTIGVNAGIFKGIGSFEAGEFSHSFQKRDVMPVSDADLADEAKVYVDMGVPLKTALRRQGWSEADLKQLEADQAEQSEKEKETLAAAVLRAQRAMDSGAASTGLETGTPTDEAAPSNLESTKGLNGAQINAAMDILAGVSAGSITTAVAIELLVALGIDRERAVMIVQSTQKLEPRTQPSPPAPRSALPSVVPEGEGGQ